MKTKEAFHCITRVLSSALLIICCSIPCLLASASAHAAGTLDKIAKTGSITLGYRQSIPFSYLDANKQPVGYTMDLCMKIVDAIKRELKRPDLAVKLAEVDSVSRTPLTVDGTIDFECSSSAINAERRQKVEFSIPTFITAIRIMVREGGGIKGIANLAGKNVVTTQASSSVKLFNDLNQLRGLNATLVLTKDHAEAFAMLESGRADAFILNDALLYSLRAVSREPAKSILTRDALTYEPHAIMMRKDDPELKKLVDAEISRIILSGEINAIYRKWFESTIPPFQASLNMPKSFAMSEYLKSPGEWKSY